LAGIRKTRSHDFLPPPYHDVGQFYWHRVDSFLKRESKKYYKKIPFMVSELEMHDIDSEDDWRIAENKYKLLRQF